MLKNKSLYGYNTFGVEAKASLWAEFSSEDDLRRIMDAAPERWYVLAGGSNTLFTKDFDGLILHPVAKDITLEATCGDDVLVRVSAAVEWDDFVAWCVERGYGGIENLSYIPGYAGASPVQNIGAYGVEAGDRIESVEYFDVQTGRCETISGSECGFGYRDSVFKGRLSGRAIVLSVLYRLTTKPIYNIEYGDVKRVIEGYGEGISLDTVRRAVIEIRRQKLPEPSEIGNAGSFFKNPIVEQSVVDQLRLCFPEIPSYPAIGGVKIPAGWLIDRAGWKGCRRGNVGVHERQALVLVNFGGATGNEVVALAEDIVDDVHSKFGVRISPEVNIL